MSTRSGSYGHRLPEFNAQLEKYAEYFHSRILPPTSSSTSSVDATVVEDPSVIKFLDGTIAEKCQENPIVSIGTLVGDCATIKLPLMDLVSKEFINNFCDDANIFHHMKLKLSKLFFALVLHSYESNKMDLFHTLSKKKNGLTDFIVSLANAMNGNYIFQTGKESFLSQYDVLSFIVDYLRHVNEDNNEYIILNNVASRQIIKYIGDQYSTNIKNSIHVNTKILIRIFIEYRMRIVIKKKKIRVKNKDIKIRNKLRDDIYNQRRIIQSVIFQYKIEVILTYLHLFYIIY